MKSATRSFRELHHTRQPLLIGNAWSAQSAAIMEKLQFDAIATSSAAVAETLGYRDGENMPFEEYFYMVRRIRSAVSVPLSVDLEGGYGATPHEIVQHITRLHEAGVAGINIEDSLVTGGERRFRDPVVFGLLLREIKAELAARNIDMFINVRCDAFLLGVPGALEEAVMRLKAYEKADADGIFLPCITAVEDIKTAVAATPLPVNVMCMPGLPDFNTLQSLGVRRISMGNFVNSMLYSRMATMVETIVEEQSFSSLFQ